MTANTQSYLYNYLYLPMNEYVFKVNAIIM